MKNNAVTDEYMRFLKRVGENLSKARIEKGLSQRELGKIIEKNHNVIAKVEKYPPLDLSLRSIYEIARQIPVSLVEVIGKAESDVTLHELRKEPGKIGDRLKHIVGKLQELTPDEQVWIADIIERLLARTSSPSMLLDKNGQLLDPVQAAPN